MKNVVFSLFALLAITKVYAQSLKGSRPNIILIMTDDQGMGDIACLGNQLLKTPNMDKFYEMSMHFNEMHVSPSCSPTRSALMSGRHEFRNGVTHTTKERELMALSTTTFPQLLQEAGYQTGIFGKWHLGDPNEYQPYNRGFSEVFIHGAGGIGQSSKGSSADFPPNGDMPGRYFDNLFLHNDKIVQTKGFCTDVLFEAALGWIKQKDEAEEPYFAYVVTNAPHGPMIAPDNYKKKWLDDGWSENLAGRYGMIENIDDNLGLLMKKLDEWDAWDNTLVIFMSDNGQSLLRAKKDGKLQKLYSGGFKTGKGTPYEGGTHVPSFWCWKGVLNPGEDVGALVAHIDFYKTFCDLTGASIPDDIQQIDGRTLLPLLENPKVEWDDRNLFIHRGRWDKGVDPNMHKLKDFAVRTQRWRFVNDTELYDIEKDPYETTNVIAQYPEVVKKIRKAYDIWWNETVEFMVNEDKPYAKVQPYVVRYYKQKEEIGIPEWEKPEL